MLRLCSPQLDSSPQALLRRIEALEQGTAESRTVQSVSRHSTAPEHFNFPLERREAPEKTVEPQNVSVPTTTVPVEPEQKIGELKDNAEQLAEWPEIVQALKSYSHTIAAAFNGSSAYVSGDYVLIDAPNEIAFKLLRKPEHRANMRSAIQQVTGRTYRLGPYRKPQESRPEDDPLAQLAQKAEKQGIPVETT
jgi:DNA polymerase-3 subunit gamma/tau